MSDKYSIKKEREHSFATGFLVLAAAALLVAAYAVPATAEPMSYTGQVSSIDSATRTLTVESGAYDAHVFSWHDGTSAMMCDRPVSFENIKIGDEVTVLFEESGERYIAENVTLTGGKC